MAWVRNSEVRSEKSKHSEERKASLSPPSCQPQPSLEAVLPQEMTSACCRPHIRRQGTVFQDMRWKNSWEKMGRQSRWKERASTHRISRLVVPLRSGNSRMSVAPFRDLETETSLEGGSRHLNIWILNHKGLYFLGECYLSTAFPKAATLALVEAEWYTEGFK